MSISFGSECPSCHKRFDNDSLVLRHMNNPRTTCASWLDFLESIAPSQSNRSANNHTPENSGIDHNVDTADYHAPATTRYEDIHPNIPLVFGSGPGFMDNFDADPHTEKRGGNLYYPFSSRKEWSLASWLLCSGLSMRVIDDFLALPIVRLEKYPISSLLIKK